MVLACWWSVSAAVGSLFLGRAAAMQGEHYYVLTSLLIVYAGQHAAFKDEIGPSRAHLDARADSRKGAITLRRRRRSPSGSPRGLRVAIVSFSFCLLNLFCLKVPLLVWHLTHRGASWASGAAQAAQVVRIILRFAASLSDSAA